MEKDYKCPKCGSDHTTRVPIELFSEIKGTWYLLIICSLFLHLDMCCLYYYWSYL